jgi:hypothetical protein
MVTNISESAPPDAPPPALLGFRQGLTTSEQNLLFCVASGTDWAKAGIPSAIASVVAVKGLIARETTGQFALTDRGHAALQKLQQEASTEFVQSHECDRSSDQEDLTRPQHQITDAHELMARFDEAVDQMKWL